jgi:tetratricopeptide (TPR) repeat protein
LPLLSRFDGRDEIDEAKRWIDRFARDLKPFYDEWLPKKFNPRQILEFTKIPYVTKFSFGEPLPVLSHSTSDPELPGFYLENVSRLLVTDFQDAAKILAPELLEEDSIVHTLRAQLAQLPIDEAAIIDALKTVEDQAWENPELINVVVETAIGLLRHQHFDSAELIFRRAIEMGASEFGHESPIVVQAFAGLAELLQSTGRFSEAEEVYRQILSILQKTSLPNEDKPLHSNTISDSQLVNRKAQVQTFGFLAELYQRQRRFEEAIDVLRLSLDISEELRDKRTMAQTMHSLGNIYQRQRRFEEAIDVLRHSLAVSEELRDKRTMAQTMHSLGNIYQRQGRFEEAIDVLRHSLAVSEKLRDKRTMAQTMHFLGNIYQRQRRFEEAIDVLRHSLAVSEELRDKRAMAQTMRSLGNIYQRQGRLEEAIDVLRHSLAVSEELRDKRTMAQTMHSLGNIYQGHGKYEEAIDVLRHSLDISEQLRDKVHQAQVLFSLGKLVWDKDIAEGRSFFLRSIDILKSIGDRRSLARVNQELNKRTTE